MSKCLILPILITLIFEIFINLLTAATIPENKKLGSPYCSDPHQWALEGTALKGPCGRQHAGYLTYKQEHFILIYDNPSFFDRHLLINPEPPKASERKLIPVAPIDQEPSTLSTRSPLVDGTLETFRENDNTTWNVSSSQPEFTKDNIHLLPTSPSIQAQIRPEDAHILSNPTPEAPVLISPSSTPLSVPAQLLYFFQQPINTHPHQNAVVLPFELPLKSTDLNQGNTQGTSKATYQIE